MSFDIFIVSYDRSRDLFVFLINLSTLAIYSLNPGLFYTENDLLRLCLLSFKFQIGFLDNLLHLY